MELLSKLPKKWYCAEDLVELGGLSKNSTRVNLFRLRAWGLVDFKCVKGKTCNKFFYRRQK